MTGIEIKIRRTRARVSQSRVAAVLGISQTVLCAIESEKRPVSIAEAEAINEAIVLASEGKGGALVPFTDSNERINDDPDP